MVYLMRILTRDETLVKCTYCNERAIIKLGYSRLRLCEKHITKYLIRRVLSTIERYHMISKGERILIAISGGKDSASLAHIMKQISNQLNFKILGFHINLNINDYSKICLKEALSLFNTLDINHITIELEKVLGLGIPKIAKKLKRKECSVCGLIKRYLMSYVARQLKLDKIATGHTLDDMVQYIMKTFIMQDLEYLWKLTPSTETNLKAGLIGRIKPLCEISEKETLVYAYANKLPFTLKECPMVRWDTIDLEIKSFMKLLESKYPGIRISLLRKFVRNARNFYKYEHENKLRKCIVCGMVTNKEVCAFCNMLEKLGQDIDEVLCKIDREIERAFSI